MLAIVLAKNTLTKIALTAITLLLLSTAPVLAATKVGAYVPGSNVSAIEEFEALTDRHQDYFLYYRNWDGGFDSWLPTQMVNRGTTPMVTWEPWNRSLTDIANGTHDSYIRSFANSMKTVPGTVLLRPMHEMNGNWYPWGAGVNGNTPQQYVDAFRHIVDVFNSQGVTNVEFVWSPNHEGLPSWNADSIPSYFPGDAYVDHVAIDGYNFGTSKSWSNWRSFDTVFGSAYNKITNITSKPIMIGETASGELGGDKAAWITDAYNKAENNYPNIKAVIWFHADKETDWRANSSTSALTAFKAAMVATSEQPAPTPDPEPTPDPTPEPEPTYTANVSSPANDSLVKRNVSVKGSSDGSKTQVVVDGTVKTTVSGSSVSWTWNTRDYANGSHTVTINGLNNNGSVVASDSVTVKVDNKAPRGKVRRTTKSATATPTYNFSNAAEDENGIAKVTFYIDGKLQKQDYSAPYGWDLKTDKLSRGFHTVKVNTFDKAWNLNTETVRVWTAGSDVTGPSAKLTNPTSWKLYQRYSSLWLVGQVTDPSGIAKVTFSIDGKLRAQDYSAPFAWNWSIGSERSGWHVIKMNSFDKRWNLTTTTKWVYLTW